jgi:hypothetical protein
MRTCPPLLHPQDYLFVLRAAVSRSAIFLSPSFSEGYTALPSRHGASSHPEALDACYPQDYLFA